MNMKHAKIIYNLSLFALLLGLANSCMVGPNFQKVEIESPDSYRYQDSARGTETVMDWSTFFNDKVLQELIDSALVNNKDMRIAISKINESRAYLGMANADLYPGFSYSASSSFGNSLTPGGDANAAFTGTANINWELVFWGKYRRASEAAQADLVASEYGLKAIELSLIAQVSNTYYSLLDYKNRLRIAKSTLDSRTESLRIVRERFEKGIVPEIDLNQAQIQEATAAAAIPVYERSIAFTENALSILIGENPRNFIAEVEIENINLPDFVPAGLPSELLLKRPDILEAEQLLKAQNARIGVAQAMRFPSISLTGFLGLSSPELSDFNAFGSIGADLFGPIFYFGKNKRRVEAAQEVTEQFKLNYEKAVLSAFRETEDALVYIRTLQQELVFVEKQLAASRNGAKLARQRYDGGVTSYLEVLDAERGLFNIELYYSETLQKIMGAHTDLYKALGGDW